jgi:hypothetical protein
LVDAFEALHVVAEQPHPDALHVQRVCAHLGGVARGREASLVALDPQVRQIESRRFNWVQIPIA